MKRILLCLLYLSPLFGSQVLYAQQPDSSASAPAQSKAAASPVAPRSFVQDQPSISILPDRMNSNKLFPRYRSVC